MDLSERPSDSAATERRHPWELARYQFFRRVLRDSGLSPRRILDAGAGDGWFSQQLLEMLPSDARVTCWDAHYAPELMDAFANLAPPTMRFTKERPDEKFDLIMLLDVLEHVEGDSEFLTTLVRENLAQDGAVLISVPAWQQLFTAHDTRLRHHRRYKPADAADLIEQSGLTIVQRGGLFHALLLPRAAEKARELIAPAKNGEAPSLEWSGGPLLTRAVSLMLEADNRVSLLASKAGLELPGLSWWALCKRP